MVKDYLNLVNVKNTRGRVEELARSPEFREVFGGVVSRAMADIFISTELCSSFAAAEGFVYLYISDAQRKGCSLWVSILMSSRLRLCLQGILVV
jgi:16S rRNA G527 N7-methylase RsmG